MALAQKPKLLFVLEGNTDIRFVAGLCQYFHLTIIGPSANLRQTGGLLERIERLGLDLKLIELSGGRLVYQLKSFIEVFKIAKNFDVLFSQENLRGTLNAGLIGRLLGVPVISHSGMPPREYFRCRYERGQISWAKYFIGDTVIKTLLFLNARLCHYWFVLGPYLYKVFSPYKKNIGPAHYYGVDVDLYHPVSEVEKNQLRAEYDFEEGDFIIFFSSRVSHEKDPETVLYAVHELVKEYPQRRLFLMNLGGGHEKIRKLALSMGLSDVDKWLVTRPAAHPMEDLPRYYQLSDLVIQASLEEGLGLSPLEGLACGIPVIASNVGGMKAHLAPFARMVERQDKADMVVAIREFLEGQANPSLSDGNKDKGRRYVSTHWSRELAFENLSLKIYELISK